MGVTQELTKMRRTMHDVFGIRRLRLGQEDVIRSIVAGRVAEVEDDKVVVAFKDGEKRTFKKEFVTPLRGRQQ